MSARIASHEAIELWLCALAYEGSEARSSKPRLCPLARYCREVAFELIFGAPDYDDPAIGRGRRGVEERERLAEVARVT